MYRSLQWGLSRSIRLIFQSRASCINASRRTMTQTVFMDGRDNGPAMTNRVGLHGQFAVAATPKTILACD